MDPVGDDGVVTQDGGDSTSSDSSQGRAGAGTRIEVAGHACGDAAAVADRVGRLDNTGGRHAVGRFVAHTPTGGGSPGSFW